MRPWTYRFTCLALFLAAMYVLRTALQALKDTHDFPLIASVCIPGTVGCISLAFWLERRGY